MVRQLVVPEDPVAAVGRREDGLGGPAAACSGSEGSVASAVGSVSGHWDILNYACHPGVVGGSRSAAGRVAGRGVWVVPSACSQTQSPTWCWLSPGKSVAAARPSSSDCVQMPTEVARQRCLRRRHRAGRKKKRRPGHGWAGGRSRGLAEPDTWCSV